MFGEAKKEKRTVAGLKGRQARVGLGGLWDQMGGIIPSFKLFIYLFLATVPKEKMYRSPSTCISLALHLQPSITTLAFSFTCYCQETLV